MKYEIIVLYLLLVKNEMWAVAFHAISQIEFFFCEIVVETHVVDGDFSVRKKFVGVCFRAYKWRQGDIC